MLQLTEDQMVAAASAARMIRALEAEKDAKHYLQVSLKTVHDPLGQGFEMPREMVLTILNGKIAEQHAILHGLGIELVHGGGSGG